MIILSVFLSARMQASSTIRTVRSWPRDSAYSIKTLGPEDKEYTSVLGGFNVLYFFVSFAYIYK